MNNKPKINFKEYYPFYLNAHKHPATKLLHFLGQLNTILYVWFILYLSTHITWLLLGYLWFTPNIVYLTAWPSHWWIEKNEPLAFSNKWYAKLSDLKMLFDCLMGKVKLDTRN